MVASWPQPIQLGCGDGREETCNLNSYQFKMNLQHSIASNKHVHDSKVRKHGEEMEENCQ